MSKLNKKYMALMDEARRVSTTDRAKSDLIYAEAQKILDEMESLGES